MFRGICSVLPARLCAFYCILLTEKHPKEPRLNFEARIISGKPSGMQVLLAGLWDILR